MTPSAFSKSESDARNLDALTKLAFARCVQIEDDQYRVFLDGLADLDTDSVVRACRLLSQEQRKDFEPTFPQLGTIRERVFSLQRPDPILETGRLLAQRSAGREPSREASKKFLADLKAEIARRKAVRS